MNLAIGPVVVEWWDAHESAAHWTPVDDLTDDRRVMRTVGWIVGLGDHIHLAQSIDDETEHVDNVLAIPRPNVIDMEYLAP